MRSPLGVTRTPKPVTSLSHTVKRRAPAARPSIERLVNLSRGIRRALSGYHWATNGKKYADCSGKLDIPELH